MLDGSDDPPVYVAVDSSTAWQLQASTFSAHVQTCVWDYKIVLGQRALVAAQNVPVSSESVDILERTLHAEPRTFGWPGSTQYRFSTPDQGVLIWSGEDQADWFVGATDVASLETVLKRIWNLDRVGKWFYGCSETSEAVLAKIRQELK